MAEINIYLNGGFSMPVTTEVLDQILKDYEKPEDLLSENGLLQQLTKALLEHALNVKLIGGGDRNRTDE